MLQVLHADAYGVPTTHLCNHAEPSALVDLARSSPRLPRFRGPRGRCRRPAIFSIFRKFANFRKMVKISFWHRFWPFWTSKSNSPCKTISIHSLKSLFYRLSKNSNFWKPVFAYFWTFEPCFRPREHSHQIRREKIPQGSYP